MLNFKRIIVAGFVYENVDFIDRKHEQYDLSLDEYIDDPQMKQICIRTNDGSVKYISDWNIIEIWYKSAKPCSDCKKIKRLVLAGEISHGPVYIVPKSLYSKYDIPHIVDDQLVFIAEKKNLYISRQRVILQIED